MGQDFTKQQRGKIRALAALAHERDLSAELAKVENDFKRWRAGEIDAFDLNDAIHRFHQRPSREVFSRYSGPLIDVAVAGAIARGVISEAEVGTELLEAMRGLIEFARTP